MSLPCNISLLISARQQYSRKGNERYEFDMCAHNRTK
jgi:hypothetical protein